MLLLWNDMACRIVKIHFQMFHLAFGYITGHGWREGHKPRLQCGKMIGNQGHSTMFRLTRFGETYVSMGSTIQGPFSSSNHFASYLQSLAYVSSYNHKTHVQSNMPCYAMIVILCSDFVFFSIFSTH